MLATHPAPMHAPEPAQLCIVHRSVNTLLICMTFSLLYLSCLHAAIDWSYVRRSDLTAASQSLRIIRCHAVKPATILLQAYGPISDIAYRTAEDVQPEKQMQCKMINL